MPTQLFALAIGINQYQSSNIPQLTGCLNDVHNLKTYLQTNSQANNIPLHYQELCDDHATKANIVKLLTHHFEQATANDICLLYYAGHGGREYAPDAWRKHTKTGYLESIVCHDSTLEGATLLDDKEIRWLIYQIYQKTHAEIVTIFDCCHSGGVTRTTGENETQARNAGEYVWQKRQWSDFIFHNALQESDIANAANLETLLPQGEHLQLAACQDKETAKETTAYNGKKQGIFSTCLLQLLQQCTNKISYNDLINNIRLRIQERYQQVPQLYVVGAQNKADRYFLGGISLSKNKQAQLIFDLNTQHWKLNKGTMHGIDQSKDLSIDVYDADNNFVAIATITAVALDYSLVEADNLSDKDKIYYAYWEALNTTKSVDIAIKAPDENTKQQIKRYLDGEKGTLPLVQISENLISPDYFISAKAENWDIIQAQNGLPVVQSFLPRQYDALIYYLKHLSNWHLLRQFNHAANQLPIALKLCDAQQNTLYSTQQNHREQSISLNPDQKDCRISLTNLSNNTEYYVALLLLSHDYAIKSMLHNEGNTLRIAPNQTIDPLNGNTFNINILPHIETYNWLCQTDYLLIIAAKTPFSVDNLLQDALPMPQPASTNKPQITRQTFRRKNETPAWAAQCIAIKTNNIAYKKTQTEINGI